MATTQAQSREVIKSHEERLTKLAALMGSIPSLLDKKKDARAWSHIRLEIVVKDGVVDLIEFEDSVTIK